MDDNRQTSHASKERFSGECDESDEFENCEEKDKDLSIFSLKPKKRGKHAPNWDEMFSRLLNFRNKHGHCLVPYRYTEDSSLGLWVSKQRSLYKNMVSGSGCEFSPLTEERAAKLLEIGFATQQVKWSSKSWDARFGELLDFVQKHGHARVPPNWKENIQLSQWVSQQRLEYKFWQVGKRSRLTDGKIKLLNDMGFEWKSTSSPGKGGPGTLIPKTDTSEVRSSDVGGAHARKRIHPRQPQLFGREQPIHPVIMQPLVEAEDNSGAQLNRKRKRTARKSTSGDSETLSSPDCNDGLGMFMQPQMPPMQSLQGLGGLGTTVPTPQPWSAITSTFQSEDEREKLLANINNDFPQASTSCWGPWNFVPPAASFMPTATPSVGIMVPGQAFFPITAPCWGLYGGTQMGMQPSWIATNSSQRSGSPSDESCTLKGTTTQEVSSSVAEENYSKVKKQKGKEMRKNGHHSSNTRDGGNQRTPDLTQSCNPPRSRIKEEGQRSSQAGRDSSSEKKRQFFGLCGSESFSKGKLLSLANNDTTSCETNRQDETCTSLPNHVDEPPPSHFVSVGFGVNSSFDVDADNFADANE